VQSSTCADVNIWSRNEKKKGLAGEMREAIEEIGEKMGEKMGEEGCEGERETAQVSSSIDVVVNVQWSQIQNP
jgi:hypothetical protein